MIIKDNTFIVTGGASGLGEATVGYLIHRGAHVAIFDLNVEKGRKIENSSKNIIYLQVDITKEEQVQSGIDAAYKRWNKVIAGVINCGGVGSVEKLVNKKKQPLNLETFKFVVEVNLIGTINVCRLVASHIAKYQNYSSTNKDKMNENENGIIINVASVAAYDGQQGQAAYAASKGAIASLTLPLARDLAILGIRVVTIAPGLFETSMSAGIPEKAKNSIELKMLEFPKRFGNPEEFAHLALSIIENTYLNGEVIRLDGAARLGKL